MTFPANDTSCLDAKRANNDTAIVGIGMALSIACVTVHRPSPESSM